MSIFNTIFGWDRVSEADAELQRQVDEYNEFNGKIAEQRQGKPTELSKSQDKMNRLQQQVDTINAKSRQVANSLRNLAVQQLELNKKKTTLVNLDSSLRVELEGIIPSLNAANSEYKRLEKRAIEEKQQARKAKKDAADKAAAEMHRQRKEELAARDAAVAEIEAAWQQGKEVS